MPTMLTLTKNADLRSQPQPHRPKNANHEPRKIEERRWREREREEKKKEERGDQI